MIGPASIKELSLRSSNKWVHQFFRNCSNFNFSPAEYCGNCQKSQDSSDYIIQQNYILDSEREHDIDKRTETEAKEENFQKNKEKDRPIEKDYDKERDSARNRENEKDKEKEKVTSSPGRNPHIVFYSLLKGSHSVFVRFQLVLTSDLYSVCSRKLKISLSSLDR